MAFYNTILNLCKMPVHLLYRLRAVGVENIPETGCILASNHTSFVDVFLISVAARRQVRYMAKKELFKIPLLGSLIASLGAYPVNRGGADVSSIKRTIQLIENGDLIGIFPQGHRFGKTDPRTTPVKGGVGMIAYHAKACVVPAFVEKVGVFRVNTVQFGKPIPYDQLGFVNGGVKEYQSAAEKIFTRVCALQYGEDTVLLSGTNTDNVSETEVTP